MHNTKAPTQRAKANSQAKPKQCSHYYSCASQKQKRNLTHRSSLPRKFTVKNNHPRPQPNQTPFKDVKEKGKLVSNSEEKIKKTTTNRRKDKTGFVKNQHKEKQTDSNKANNKIKVFTIKRKDKTTLIK